MNYPKLTPIVHPWIHDFLSNGDYVKTLLDTYGSPINVHNTEPFVQNHQEYVQVLQKHQLVHQVFFARKANKSRCFVRAAKQHGFGVDTASVRELTQCLELGVPPAQLVVTAAVKTRQLMELVVKHGVLVILDNVDEINLLKEVARSAEKKVPIGLRISGFAWERTKLYSRFGFDITKLMAVYRSEIHESEWLDFKGFHFHLNGYSTGQRSEALYQTLDLVTELKTMGVKTEFIDIGGGLLMNYLAEQAEWDAFRASLRNAVIKVIPPITFGNDGLGYELKDEQIQGDLNTYPYFNQLSKGKFLDEVLSYTTPEGEKLSKLIRDLNIQLRLEPGRSLLDQSGITLARVVYRKMDSRKDVLVGLEMNRTQLFSSSADFLLDPIYLPKNPDHESNPTSVFFTGAYCLEQDVILKRKITLPTYPEIGDMVCFVNTAGYMMHFYESEAHLFDLSKNLVVSRNKQNGYDVRED